MVKELKALRDSTVLEWEDALKKAKEISASYVGDIKAIDKDMTTRASKLHNQVDAILSKCRQSLHKLTAQELEKLQNQETFVTEMLKQLKGDVEQYHEQLVHNDPNVLLQFDPGNLPKKEKPPVLSMAATDSLPFFVEGENDSTKLLEKLFGEILIPDIGQETATKTSTSQSLSTDQKLSFEQSATQLSETDINIPMSHLICELQLASYFQVKWKTYRQFIKCDTSKFGLTWINGIDHDRTVQLVNKRGSVQDTIDFEASFIKDLSLASNGDIIVIDDLYHCVKSAFPRWSIRNLLSGQRVRTLFRTEWEPSSVCCLQGGDIVVAFLNDRKVIRYSSTGEIRQRYSSITFICPQRVASSKVNQDIYILDALKLLAVDCDGQIRFEYRQSMSVPVDICADHLGHVLVFDPSFK